LLDREDLSQSWHRLGCQARVLGDVVVRVPESKFADPKFGEPSAIQSEAQGVDIR